MQVKRIGAVVAAAGIVLSLAACQVKAPAPEYDLVVRHGTLYDGSGDQRHPTANRIYRNDIQPLPLIAGQLAERRSQ